MGTAKSDVFVVAGDNRVLYLTGSTIPADHDDLPTVPAVFDEAQGNYVPGTVAPVKAGRKARVA